jgi:hypothetical protein
VKHLGGKNEAMKFLGDDEMQLHSEDEVTSGGILFQTMASATGNLLWMVLWKAQAGHQKQFT